MGWCERANARATSGNSPTRRGQRGLVARPHLVVFALSVAACHSHHDTSAHASPASAAPSAPPATAVARICEPTVACGIWSPCMWLEVDHVEPAGSVVYRVSGSDAGGFESHFRRVHHCYPEDAGQSGCALYCGPSGPCVDALTSDGACTGAAPPHPSPYRCEARGDACTTVALDRGTP